MSGPRPFSSREEAILFPTRVFTFELAVTEVFNRALSALIEERSRELPTCARGELTGWQSDNSFFDWSDATSYLRHVIAQAVQSLHPSLADLPGMNLSGWANRLCAGDYFTPHTHGGAAWSGVYYADAGESSNDLGGVFTVRDPRSGANMNESPLSRFDSACTASFQPATGELLIFPPWLVHWVTPYRGQRPRVSISFNAW